MEKPVVFIAGATGAIGLPLARLLVGLNQIVYGLTRNPDKATMLGAIGVKPIIADVYDPVGLTKALAAVQPEIVFHQLTDLPYGLPADKMAQALQDNDKIRIEGTSNLLQALNPSRLKKLIAQSIAFRYCDGSLPHKESDPLNSDTLNHFEQMVLSYKNRG